MVSGRKTAQKSNENISDVKERLKIKKKYEKKFFWAALKLCVYRIKYKIFSGIANCFFSRGKQKKTIFLKFTNRAVNKNICKCQIMADKCEDYMQKIANA